MTTDKKYPPSGVLFKAREKRTDKSPDWTGELEITADVLGDLMLKADKNEPLKMRLIAYENTHPQRGLWYRLRADKDEPFMGKREYQRNDRKTPF